MIDCRAKGKVVNYLRQKYVRDMLVNENLQNFDTRMLQISFVLIKRTQPGIQETITFLSAPTPMPDKIIEYMLVGCTKTRRVQSIQQFALETYRTNKIKYGVGGGFAVRNDISHSSGRMFLGKPEVYISSLKNKDLQWVSNRGTVECERYSM